MEASTPTPEFWKSVAERDRTPEYEEALHREFQGAVEPESGSLTRRQFMALSAAASALTLTGCFRPEQRIVPAVKGREGHVEGKSDWYASALPLAGGATGILIESYQGRPIKLEGNPDHPLSEGATDKWVQAALLSLYDPDRVQGPRIGGKAATWAAVDDKVVAALNQARLSGKGVRILMDAHCSPSLASCLSAFTAQFSNAKAVVWEAVGEANAARAAEVLFGAPLRPVVDFTKARTALCIEDDFLSTTPNAVDRMRSFARARAVDQPDGDLLRVYALESAMTLTGANADHRLRVAPSRIPGFLSALIARVAALKGSTVALPTWPAPSRGSISEGRFQTLVRDLTQRASVVTVGAHQPPVVHGLAMILNAVLASPALRYEPRAYAVGGDVRALSDLLEECRSGAVHTLIIAGVNPAHAAPGQLDVAGALRAVPLTFALCDRVDETAALCTALGPQAQALEQWGDVEPRPGLYTVVQPAIAPLFGGRSLGECLLKWMEGLKTAPAPSWYDHVRGTWKALHASSGSPVSFDAFWEGVLYRGVYDTGRDAAVVPPTPMSSALAKLEEARKQQSPMELVFLPSSALYDGRWANNGWLQELPDPVTKITWDNVAAMSIATAKKLGVEFQDRVTLTANGVSLTLPVLVQPGMADDVVAVTLGYGRTACGGIGEGVGVNVAPLASSRIQGWMVSSVTVAPASGRHPLACTQDHWSMEGRPILLEGTLEEYKEHPDFAQHRIHHPPLTSIFDEHEYTGHFWGMAIDLGACVGCNACVVACTAENNIPSVGKDEVLNGREMHWIRIDRYYGGEIADPTVTHQPMLCQHCMNAPCENVCPVAATTHSPEGLNEMTYNRCVGTRYCANNCPYKVRRFNFLNYNEHISDSEALSKNPEVTVRARGVMEKCTFCVQRLTEAKHAARSEGRERVADGAVKTACQQVCPTGAIVFGDMNDPRSAVSAQRKSPRGYRVLEELNVKPSITYLAKVRNAPTGGAA